MMDATLRIVGALALLVAIPGQAPDVTRGPSTARPDAILRARHMHVGVATEARNPGHVVRGRAVAKSVEIRIGSALLVADEAEIRHGAQGEPSEVDLRGNVRLKAVIDVEYAEQQK